MKQAALNLLGVLTGLTLGWIAVATPLAAVFAPARVTWDATGCPAGTYTITSTAQKFGSGETFFATTRSVRLPQSTFIQEFADLPNGTYSVSASLQGDDGTTLEAARQMIQSGPPEGGSDPGHRPPPPLPPPSTTALTQRDVGHQRSTSAPSSGYTLVQGAQGSTSNVTSQPIIAAPPSSSDEPSSPEVRRLLDAAGQLDWRRIDVLDLDADGSIDQVTIELAGGAIYIFTIHGQ